MTANSMHGDRERCIEAGMNGYISKPIRVEELVAAIRALVALRLELHHLAQGRLAMADVEGALDQAIDELRDGRRSVLNARAGISDLLEPSLGRAPQPRDTRGLLGHDLGHAYGDRVGRALKRPRRACSALRSRGRTCAPRRRTSGRVRPLVVELD
jgi:hypothetical protein